VPLEFLKNKLINFMQVRHKRHARGVRKDWGSEIKIIDNTEENFSGKILNLNQNQHTPLHYHAKKSKTIYVLSGILTIEVIEPETGQSINYTIETEECFDIDRHITHALHARDGNVVAIEMSSLHSDEDVYRVISK